MSLLTMGVYILDRFLINFEPVVLGTQNYYLK